MPQTQYYYFTEQPYTGYDPALQDQYPALRLNLPNTNYDPQIASDLYNRYVKMFGEPEDQVTRLRGEIKSFQEKEQSQRQELDKYVLGLEIG